MALIVKKNSLSSWMTQSKQGARVVQNALPSVLESLNVKMIATFMIHFVMKKGQNLSLACGKSF